MTSRLIRSGLPVALALLVAACENPTAPQILKEIDSIQQDVSSGSPWSSRVWRGRFGGGMVAGIKYLHPDGRSDLRIELEGETRSFTSFVLERVVIRQDPHDGYPCPLVSRSMVGVEGTRRAVIVTGSDFSRNVGPTSGCEFQLGSSTPSHWGPSIMVEDSAGSRLAAIGGKASITSNGTTESCKFARDLHFPDLRVDCEIVEYLVSANALLDSKQKLEIPGQVIRGVRLTVHCDGTGRLGGCEVMRPQ